MKFSKEKTDKNDKTDFANTSKNISLSLEENVSKIGEDFGYSSDFEVNYYEIGKSEKINCASIYISSLIDKETINSLSVEMAKIRFDSNENFDYFINTLSGLRALKERFDYDTLCNNLLSGNTIFLIDGCNKYFSVATAIDEGRTIDEPTSQNVIKGPKEAFTERIYLNILLIRKRLKYKDLRVENLTIGNKTKTTVSLIYINKIAKDDIVQEIKSRLESIEIDGILESGYIEELIKDDRYSIFPTFSNSERPDSVSASILEGKIAILVDGTPYVITAPALMIDFFQSSEDYYHNYIIASFARILRIIAFFLTLLVPAVYVALTTFHQEMIPTALLISIAAQREDVPFPAVIEALIMETTFEILREAGIRMPKVIGPAISIVGALVLGQAAVDAGIISAAMVIVVSITAISSFAITNYDLSNAVRVIRFILIILSSILGLYGLFIALIIMVLHLCKIKSIGVPYMTPIAPKIKTGNRDTFFRFPLWKMKYRPYGISGVNTIREDEKNKNSDHEKKKPELR